MLRDLYSPEARIRWTAVHDLGRASIERPAAKTRELLRRLAWSLNEESGATGWGAPEAMGEIIACVPEHLSEFEHHFLGYLSDDETFLDNPVLDGGALWALGRLGRGSSFDEAAHELAVGRFLEHPDAAVRGLAAWGARCLGLSALEDGVSSLAGDSSPLWLLLDGEVVERTVSELAGL